jgi:hypothetical protein
MARFHSVAAQPPIQVNSSHGTSSDPQRSYCVGSIWVCHPVVLLRFVSSWPRWGPAHRLQHQCLGRLVISISMSRICCFVYTPGPRHMPRRPGRTLKNRTPHLKIHPPRQNVCTLRAAHMTPCCQCPRLAASFKRGRPSGAKIDLTTEAPQPHAPL